MMADSKAEKLGGKMVGWMADRKVASKDGCWVDQKVVEMVVGMAVRWAVCWAVMMVESLALTRVVRSVSKLVDW